MPQVSCQHSERCEEGAEENCAGKEDTPRAQTIEQVAQRSREGR
jgi:hypothetical protein